MSDPAVAVHLQFLDDAWGHAFESLRDVLGGVTEDEAAWQHPSYAAEPPEAGWPAPGTILWQVAHLAHCKRYYAAVVRARGEAAPVAPREPLDGLAAELAALEAAHAEQRAAVAELTDADLDVDVGGQHPRPMRDFLCATIRHDTWHGGQIAVARRLARTR